MPEIEPTHLLAGAGAVLGAAAAKDMIWDDANDPDVNPDAAFAEDLGGVDGGVDLDSGGDDYADAYSDYMSEQYAYQSTSEMMEMQHETNMEIIDNMDGSDDYYYTDDPYDW